MTDLERALRKACLLVDAHAAHASGPAAAHAYDRMEALRQDVLRLIGGASYRRGGAEATFYLRGMNTALEMVLDVRAPCVLRERWLTVFCRELAFWIFHVREGRMGTDVEIAGMLAERVTATSLAWSEVFPAELDHQAGACACGLLAGHDEIAGAPAIGTDRSPR